MYHACFFLSSLIKTCTYFEWVSRLGIQVSLAIIMCLFVWAVVGWVTLSFFFSRFLKASVLCVYHLSDVNL